MDSKKESWMKAYEKDALTKKEIEMIRKKVENGELRSTCVDMEEVIWLVKMEEPTENLDVLYKKWMNRHGL